MIISFSKHPWCYLWILPFFFLYLPPSSIEEAPTLSFLFPSSYQYTPGQLHVASEVMDLRVDLLLSLSKPAPSLPVF